MCKVLMGHKKLKGEPGEPPASPVSPAVAPSQDAGADHGVNRDAVAQSPSLKSLTRRTLKRGRGPKIPPNYILVIGDDGSRGSRLGRGVFGGFPMRVSDGQIWTRDFDSLSAVVGQMIPSVE